MSIVSDKLNFLVAHGATKKEAVNIVMNELHKANKRLETDNKLLLEGQGKQELEVMTLRKENSRLEKLLGLSCDFNIVEEAY